MSERKIAISVTKEQASLLLELLSLPAITIPFPKAKTAGDLFDEVKRVADSFPADNA